MKLLLVVAVLVSGCSIVLQDKPRVPTLGHAEQSCSTSSKFWIADAALAGLGASAAAGGRIYADVAPEHDTLAYTVAGVGAVAAIVYLASAGNGHTWATECRAQAPLLTAAR